MLTTLGACSLHGFCVPKSKRIFLPKDSFSTKKEYEGLESRSCPLIGGSNMDPTGMYSRVVVSMTRTLTVFRDGGISILGIGAVGAIAGGEDMMPQTT